jgi:hypothetical protein
MPYALLICRDENDVAGTDPGRVAEFNPFVERMGRPLLASARASHDHGHGHHR